MTILLQRWRARLPFGRDVYLLFAAGALWNFGAGLFSYIWPLYIRELDGTSVEVGLLYSATYLASALAFLPGGWLADHWERKWLIVSSWLITVPSPFLFAMATRWEGLVPGALLENLWTIGWPATVAYLVEQTSGRRQMAAFGLVYAGFPLGAVPGPLVGAALLSVLPLRSIFVISGVVFFLSAVPLLFLTPQRPTPAPHRNGLRQSFRALISKGRRGWVTLLLASAGAEWLAYPFIAPLLTDRFSLTAIEIQLLGSAVALGGVVLSWGLGRWADRSGPYRILLLCLLIGATANLVIGGLRLFLPVGMALFFLGTTNATRSIGDPLVGQYAPNGARGRAFALYLTAEAAVGASTPTLGGVLYAGSPGAPFLVGGTALIGLIVAGVWLWRQTTREAAPHPASQAP